MKSCITELIYSDATGVMSDEKHRHNTYQMIYIKKGSIKLEASESLYDCTAPCIIFISNLEPHSITVRTPVYERYILSLDPQTAAEEIKPTHLLSVFSTHRTDFCHFLDISGLQDEFDMIIENLRAERDSERAGHNRGSYGNADNENETYGERIWLCALLYKIYRFAPSFFRDAETQAEKTVGAVKRELERDLAGKLNLDIIADKYYISRYYLAHIFKSVTGYSIKQYALLCRLSYARELLTSTELNITEVAEKSGFNDTSNFARYFKDKIGMTPSEYRRNGDR